jgi:nucleoside-diphosphate-sugar epimerase
LTNSLGTKNALDLAVKNQAKFLHASSSVIYGRKEDNLEYVKEDMYGHVDLLSDRSQYDEGKRFSETMVINYSREYGIDAKIIRLFRTYGPRMMLDDGQLIPDMINNCLDGQPMSLPGNENFASSFCYVSDVVDAMLKFMASDLTGPFNIGSDVEIPLVDIAKKIMKIIGKEVEIRYNNDYVFVTPLCLPDISLARNQLGWIPVVPLEKGLEKAVYDLRASKGLKGVKHAISQEE